MLTVTVRYDEESGTFVSRAMELKLYSAGNTEVEAVEAIASAMRLMEAEASEV